MRVLAWMAVAAVAVASQTASPPSYDIAVIARGDQGEGLYVMRGDGSNATFLREESTALLTPASWSPDGKRLVYPWFEVDANGRQLDMSLPMHSPLFIVNADGTGRERLMEMPAEPFYCWSPDGSRLAFSSGFENPAPKGARDLKDLLSVQVAIYVLDLRTRKAVKVTPLGQYRYPSWSPDGRRIAFSGQADKSTDVFVVDADGKNLNRLTTTASDEQSPEWSPRGDRIAYVVTGAANQQDSTRGVFVMSADGSGGRRISTAEAEGASWSPDGTHLLAGSALINVAKEQTTELLPKTALDAAFTPDGRAILYRSGRAPSWNLVSVDLAGQNGHRIASAVISFSVSPLRK